MTRRRWIIVIAVAGAAIPSACASGVPDPKRKPIVTQLATASGDLPCDVEKILAEICRDCHTSPPRHGAPFSLATYGDTQALADGRPIYEFMGDAVASGRMPLWPMTIDAEQRATLVAWARGGGRARAAGESCVDDRTEEDAGPDVETGADAPITPIVDDGGVDAADADAEP